MLYPSRWNFHHLSKQIDFDPIARSSMKYGCTNHTQSDLYKLTINGFMTTYSWGSGASCPNQYHGRLTKPPTSYLTSQWNLDPHFLKQYRHIHMFQLCTCFKYQPCLMTVFHSVKNKGQPPQYCCFMLSHHNRRINANKTKYCHFISFPISIGPDTRSGMLSLPPTTLGNDPSSGKIL